MKTIQEGSIAQICYRGRLDETDDFDPSLQCQKMEVQVGSGEIMKGFESALIGLGPADKKIFTLLAADAFGERDDSLERTFRRSDLPVDFSAKVGDMVALKADSGDQILAVVKNADEESVTLDLNHPLAGKTLTFEVEVEDVH